MKQKLKLIRNSVAGVPESAVIIFTPREGGRWPGFETNMTTKILYLINRLIIWNVSSSNEKYLKTCINLAFLLPVRLTFEY